MPRKTKETTSVKKTTTKNKTATKKTAPKKTAITPVEYYDLPYRYNQTIVKILVQTPTKLFIYWDISDEDKENYKKIYGEDFFEKSKPVLVVHNKTMNYTFEVDINDFANSWYLDVNDSKCDYNIELGRRPLENNDITEDYIYISSSNETQAPNDRILYNIDENNVSFKNVKTNLTFSKNIALNKKIYSTNKLYKNAYKKDVLENLSSSTFK